MELIEPHVKAASEQQHIDYHFRGLEDDYTDFDDDGGSFCSDSSCDELSFDYGLNEKAYNTVSAISMEVDGHILVLLFVFILSLFIMKTF